jgi:hypothetical protein
MTIGDDTMTPLDDTTIGNESVVVQMITSTS